MIDRDPAAAAEAFQRARRTFHSENAVALSIRTLAQSVDELAREIADMARLAAQAPDDRTAVGALLDAPALLEQTRAMVGAILALNQTRVIR